MERRPRLVTRICALSTSELCCKTPSEQIHPGVTRAISLTTGDERSSCIYHNAKISKRSDLTCRLLDHLQLIIKRLEIKAVVPEIPASREGLPRPKIDLSSGFPTA